MDRLRPPLEPRVPGMLRALDPAALEDESRHEAAELTCEGELSVRSVPGRTTFSLELPS